MKPPLSDPSCDTWRWLHELEKATPAFWSLLPQLGQTPFLYRNQASCFRGIVDVENAFLNDSGFFLTSQPSLTLETSKVSRIFVEESESSPQGRLEIDFENRTSSLDFSHCPPKALQLMTTLFGWEMKPESTALSANRALAPLTVCRCCAGAAEARRASAATNPLVPILMTLAEGQQEIALNLRSPGLNLVTRLQPTEVDVQAGSIVVTEGENELRIDAGHVHGLLVKKEKLDGEAVCELSLINSHGNAFATISVPAADFQKTWQNYLSAPNGAYQPVH